MDLKFISEIRSMTAELHYGKQVLLSTRKYDPNLCKTCQKAGPSEPRIARAVYSDCEEHYQRRVARLFHSGVRVVSKDSKIEDLFTE